MTKAVFVKKNGRIVRIRCAGHSGYADAGSDIVCAAVSAVVQSTALGALRVVDARVNYQVDQQRATLLLDVGAETDPDKQRQLDVLTNTCLYSLTDIATDYRQFVVVEVQEL